MENELIYDALVDLKKSVDRQIELQERMVNATESLTEMLAHAIDAMKELTEARSN